MRATLPVLLVALLCAPALAGCLKGSPGADGPASGEAPCDAIVPLPPVAEASPGVALPPPPLPLPPGGITRDEFGVPHIEAADTLGFWSRVGYAIAQDRLWQLEHKRLVNEGRLAEVKGREALEADVLQRLRKFTPAQQAGVLASLDDDTRAGLVAYTQGINTRIAEVQRNPSLLPAEFAAFGLQPTPWRPEDVVQVMLGPTGIGLERYGARVLLQLVDTVGDARAPSYFADLAPIITPEAPSTIPSDAAAYPPFAPPDRVFPDQLAALKAAQPLLIAPLSGAGIVPQTSSNAILVAPSLTATGGALLLGGPQVGFPIPATYWEARATVDGETWSIFLKPGEGLPRGRIGEAAFVLTTGVGDQFDLVLLPLDPQDPERYLYGDASLPFAARDERFIVANKTGPARDALLARALPQPALRPDVVTLRLRGTPLGPVVAYDASLGYALVEQTAAPRGQTAYLDTFMDAQLPRLAKDPAAMRAALADLADRNEESVNVLAAFGDGTIAVWHGGPVPARAATYDPRVPRLGTPENEWRGVWAPSCMPSVVDPAQGYLLNWNNNPALNFPNLDMGPWRWGGSHRSQILEEAFLAAVAEGPLTMERLARVNREAALRDAYAWAIIPALLPLAGDGNDATRAVAAWHAAGESLEATNGRLHEGVAAYEIWRALLQEAIFGDELGTANHVMDYPDLLWHRSNDNHGTSGWTETTLVTLLQGRARADWWDDVATPEREDARAIVQRTLPLLAEAYAALGEDRRKPVVEIVFDPLGLAPEPRMPYMNRGSINYLVDLASKETWTVNPPGESGHVQVAGALGAGALAHVDDQVPLFVAFEYKRFAP